MSGVATAVKQGVRTPLGYPDLPGWADDDHAAAFRVFRASAAALALASRPLRAALAPSHALLRLCGAALALPEILPKAAARDFFEAGFQPCRIQPEGATRGFLTGYYEPVVAGAPERSAAFTAPILARPPGLGRFAPGPASAPAPTRAAIEAEAERGGGTPIVWLHDWVEVFFVQVQGSARVRLPDGGALRLVYDGRNGHAYTSIGEVLVREGHVTREALSLGRAQDWVRRHGQRAGDAGRALLQRNLSYIFFRAEPAPASAGPIGGAGVPLTEWRSIAVDRMLWSYGLPFWVDALLPWRQATPEPLRRLMIAQDTGSAILGPARADLFFGSGATAGTLAGSIRHPGELTVLLPRQDCGDIVAAGREAA